MDLDRVIEHVCIDFPFSSDDYQIRENRVLRVRPMNDFRIDRQLGLIHLRSIFLCLESTDGVASQRLLRRYDMPRRRSYRVDMVGLNDYALALHASIMEQDITLEEVYELLYLHDRLVGNGYYCQLQKRHGRPELVLYQRDTCLAFYPLKPLELTWLTVA